MGSFMGNLDVIYPPKWSFWRLIPIVLLINSVIAAGLWRWQPIVPSGMTWSNTWLTSQLIGNVIFIGQWLSGRYAPRRYRHWMLLAAWPITTIVGVYLSYEWVQHSQKASAALGLSPILIISLVIGGVVSAMFYLRARLWQAQMHATQAQLQLLQAQIEPHFLFNTLATIDSLIAINPQQAQQVLQNLTHYLRISFLPARQQRLSRVSDECSLLQAYLNIAQVRLGERLQVRLVCPATCMAQPLPLLLVQPLVENAVRHGIEPQVYGGQVTITFSKTENQLVVTVADNGCGYNSTLREGLGLRNVRARLLAHYGSHAQLNLYAPQQGRGMIAQLYLPLGEIDHDDALSDC